MRESNLGALKQTNLRSCEARVNTGIVLSPTVGYSRQRGKMMKTKTGSTKYSDTMGGQLRGLLQHTKFCCIHWLNCNQDTIELTTITKP